MTWRHLRLAAPALALVSIVLGSLCIGAYAVPVGNVVRGALGLIVPDGIWQPTLPEAQRVVVQLVRVPRVLLAGLAGAGLGLAGAAMQGMFRNPLVGPDLIGISPGASAGAALAIVLSLSPVAQGALAWGGALLALATTLLLSRLDGGRTGLLALILAGVVVSSFFSALVGLAQYLADPVRVRIMAAALVLGGVPILALRWRLNLLALRDEDAQTLGVDVAATRRVVIVASALIVAAQVTVSGIVGWIGLVVPHGARLLVGSDQRRLLPASALIGAGFTILVDDIARTATTQEIPVGLLSAIIGTPIFAVLLWRINSAGWRHG